MNFGITLSSPAVPLGLCSAGDLLALADAVEAYPVLDSVWCVDALFVNHRLDALTLLAVVAGRTGRRLDHYSMVRGCVQFVARMSEAKCGNSNPDVASLIRVTS